MSITQDNEEVKVDIDVLMTEPCPVCGITGYISIGGIGNNVTAKCLLCEYQWNPNNPLPSYGCGCVLPGQHCPDCEFAAAELYDGDELPF